MTDIHIVWAVSSLDTTEDSSDKVCAIFSTREKAEAWVEAHGTPARKYICSWCQGTGMVNGLRMTYCRLLVPWPCGICKGFGHRIIPAVPGSEIYDIEEFPFDPETEEP